MRRWKNYEVFIAVVECGSFTGAADRLGMSKSQVSRMVSQLEDKLGSELLFRSTRHLSTTDLGNIVYARCVDVFQELEDVERQAMDFDATPKGRLRVVASDTFGEACIAPLAAELMLENANLEVEVLITDRSVDIVAEGYDLAIRYDTQPDSSLLSQKLFELPHVCVASPSYLEGRTGPERPADLIGHNCLISTFGECAEWRIAGLDEHLQSQLSGNWVSNSGPSLINAALKGIGIAWLPELYLASHLKSGRLIELLADYRAQPMPVFAVYPARRHTPRKVQLLIAHLRKRLSEIESV